MKLRLLLLNSLGLCALQAALCTDTPTAQPKPTENAGIRFKKDVVPFLVKHCYSCHGNGKKSGKVTLDKFTDEDAIQKDRKLWEAALEMIRSGEMPPKEKPRPNVADIEAALKAIDALLSKTDCTGPRNVGRVTIRRLNKSEYNNTIRDLIGIDFQPAANFPADDTGFGFDNIGDVLSLSPLLLERYLSAAETILERAIVSADPVKPAKNKLGGLRAFPKGAGEVRKGVGTVVHSNGEVVARTTVEEGDYTIRVAAFGQQVGDEPVKTTLKVGDKNINDFTIKADKVSAAVILEANLRLKSGQTRVSLAFLNPFKDPKITDKAKQRRELIVKYIELDGPYNAPPPALPETHRRIMAHKPAAKPRAAAREIIERFGSRAFRRPVKNAEVERFLKLYDGAVKEGDRFENSVRLALSAVLVSPHFLFRIELDPPDAKPDTSYPVSDFNLASRLSYFLWSSMPDEELLTLAGKGQLRQNLEAQTKRMLKDPKSAAFVQNFAGQWLTIRNLASAAPDPKKFPDFDEELRAAMYRETELFFDAILREDRSILEFLDADFSFVNERLAKHYGIEGISGKNFQRVKLPPRRGGILTHASILTLTSNPTRTSPVKRGKWVMEQILGTPPPPPPPDAGELEENPKELTGSLRQRMEQHRAKASCAVCHNRMDPLGFAFENFDPIGAWREKDGKFAIDPSGVLPDGKAFKGPKELKTILKGKKDLFSRNLSEKILVYALGRGVEYYDKCALDKIIAALDKNDYRFSTLILEVVKSEPFLMRTAHNPKAK
jgi:hypothetical protein